MKFKQTVDAEQYEPGMEEGFESRFYDSANTRVTYSRPVNSRCLPIEVPFITIIDEHNMKCKQHFLNDDDWIITDAKGKKSICDADEFEELYVPA